MSLINRIVRAQSKEAFERIQTVAGIRASSLDLSSLGITAVPISAAEAATLMHLTSIDLSNNNLTSLRQDIGKLTNLEILNLHGNDLRIFPMEVFRLKLHTLNLGKNRINAVPAAIGALKHLVNLDISMNELSELPVELRHLLGLRTLRLNHNQLAKIPPELGLLKNLVLINLNYNRLAEVPAALGRLVNLEYLFLEDNSLERLPAELGQLARLRALHLKSNLLTTVPAEIGNLGALETLDLADNKLTELPPEIGRLANLEALSLGRDTARDLPIWLEPRLNQIQVLPPEIGQLTQLKRLNLNHNLLETLPAEIGRLVNLEHLDLGHNQLTTLPGEIRNLKALKYLDLRDNPLPIPPEILNKCDQPRLILDYYFGTADTPTRALNEAKVLLVGQGSVGKTSLVRRLVDDAYDPHENKTEGINIRRWVVSVNQQTVRLNVWDFGGQEIMHATHQFFLTRRSLYLLVLDSRIGEEENRLEYWLKIIQSFGGDSPIVIIGNKSDQHALDLDRRSLQYKYPQIKCFVETSCLTGEGIAALRQAILGELATMPHLHDKLPLSWFKIKERLEQDRRNFLSYEEYKRICYEQQVMATDNQKALVRFLHDLGIVLNFDDPRLDDTHVLNPAWVTTGVYAILNAGEILLDRQGILDRPTLERILDPARYPRNTHNFIIDMLRKFELCFELEGRPEHYLIPDLLPKEEPLFTDLRQGLMFHYRYSVLPLSIISRFIVRMNHLIANRMCWRNGVALASTDVWAIVRADKEERRVMIYVGGAQAKRRTFLSIIRSQFEAIHRTIPGLEVTELVPIPDNPKFELDYQELLSLESMGESEVVIARLKRRFPLKQLLDGIETESERRGRQASSYRDLDLPTLMDLKQIRLTSMALLQKQLAAQGATPPLHLVHQLRSEKREYDALMDELGRRGYR